MARPSRTALYADDTTFLWKAILRLLSIIFALVGVGTIGWAVANRIHGSYKDDDYDDNYSGFSSYYYGSDFYGIGALPFTLIPLALSILWNIANLTILFARNKPIHPGANVGCDLVLWLGLLVTGIFETFAALGYSWWSEPSYAYSSSTIDDDPCDPFKSCDAQTEYYDAMMQKGAVVVVGTAMSYLVLLFHFALFISACRYTHARRHGTASKHAQAIAAQATEIAKQMVAEMTGPNGAFRPRSMQQTRQVEGEPLLEQGRGMQQQQPMAGGGLGPGHQSAVPQPSHQQHEPTGSALPVNRGGNAAGRGEERLSGVHPALRADRHPVTGLASSEPR